MVSAGGMRVYLPLPAGETHNTAMDASSSAALADLSKLQLAPRKEGDTQAPLSDLRGQVGRIQHQVQEIQEVVRMYSTTTGPRRLRRQKTHAMSAEPTADNPYSRLLALKTLGVVKNYERVREFSVCIVGAGGVGIGVIEMLTRCGVGKIILFDHDTIELANMNKMFYKPEHAGWNKTMACRHYMSEINPDTSIEVHNLNITEDKGAQTLSDAIARGALDAKGAGTVLAPPIFPAHFPRPFSTPIFHAHFPRDFCASFAAHSFPSVAAPPPPPPSPPPPPPPPVYHRAFL